MLTEEQAEQFYKLWIQLLDFVNRKYRLFKKLYGMTSPKGLSIESVAQIAERLWEDITVIDEFAESVNKSMSEEGIAIVSSWKRAVHGEFIVDRHLKKGSVLVSVENSEVYIVQGIYSDWRELLNDGPVPQIVKTTLIPFQDVIIYDSLVMPLELFLGKNMADESKQIYISAKKNGRLHYSL
ncbi:MAG: hypothetical protein U0I51_02630 [Muricomes sp.]|uniref:hypothetical protein n=1 Tax=Faecalicatena contorta TaxID=39482 RepID=UPI002EB98560|nr:hypothetical protein [Muricomes sp.]